MGGCVRRGVATAFLPPFRSDCLPARAQSVLPTRPYAPDRSMHPWAERKKVGRTNGQTDSFLIDRSSCPREEGRNGWMEEGARASFQLTDRQADR